MGAWRPHALPCPLKVKSVSSAKLFIVYIIHSHPHTHTLCFLSSEIRNNAVVQTGKKLELVTGRDSTAGGDTPSKLQLQDERNAQQHAITGGCAGVLSVPPVIQYSLFHPQTPVIRRPTPSQASPVMFPTQQ